MWCGGDIGVNMEMKRTLALDELVQGWGTLGAVRCGGMRRLPFEVEEMNGWVVNR